MRLQPSSSLVRLAVVVWIFGVVLAAPSRAAAPNDPAPEPADPSDAFFSGDVVPELRITIAEKQERKLRDDNRNYVQCTLLEDGQVTYPNVRIKLKGNLGSFRSIDDRPCLTLNMPAENRFHGLDKFHLNNSVQDPSYLSEWVCSRIAHEAGYPAARVAHARVWLNGRDLGLYVLREGFDEPFLIRHFPGQAADGNLYDSGFCNDIDGYLERDRGRGPDDKSDLTRLVLACLKEDHDERMRKLDECLDIDAFLTFVALERMTAHKDGYTNGKNNYRVFFRGDTKKAVFLLHGMDTDLFLHTRPSMLRVPDSLVTRAVLSDPRLMERYRQRARELLPLFTPEKLQAHVDAGRQRIGPVITAMGPPHAEKFDRHVQVLRQRVGTRWATIHTQLQSVFTRALPFAIPAVLIALLIVLAIVHGVARAFGHRSIFAAYRFRIPGIRPAQMADPVK